LGASRGHLSDSVIYLYSFVALFQTGYGDVYSTMKAYNTVKQTEWTKTDRDNLSKIITNCSKNDTRATYIQHNWTNSCERV